MATYHGKTYKQLNPENGGHVWTNVYTITAADKTAAAIALDGIAEAERELYYDMVTIYKVAVSNVVKDSEFGAQLTVNHVGNRGTAGNLIIPMWNVARLDLADGLNRPQRKFFRCGFTEGDFEGNVLDSGIHGLLTTFGDFCLTVPELTGPQGETLNARVSFPNLFMRQLSWNRKARAGQHRGYVNNP